jgi:hypothetical protein
MKREILFIGEYASGTQDFLLSLQGSRNKKKEKNHLCTSHNTKKKTFMKWRIATAAGPPPPTPAPATTAAV